MNTPWGISQQVEKIQRGVVWVSTSGHGALLSSVFEYLASGKKAPSEPVVGQTLKVVKQFNSKMDIGTTLEVVEVRSTSFIARHAALGLFRVPKGFVLGEGGQAEILLEAV